jgi:dipeptidyl aminopeptidase/acylaminoacyl peptidase
MWEAQSGKPLAMFALRAADEDILTGQFKVLQLSADGRRIVTTNSRDPTTQIWETQGGKLLATLAGRKYVVMNAQFSPDGRQTVTDAGGDTLWVWETQSGKLLATLAGHKKGVTSAQFSPDSRRIVTASRDGTARVWETLSGKLLATLAVHTSDVWSAQFSSDGGRIVTASLDGTGRVWETESGKLLATLAGHENRVYSAAFSQDGTRIVTASADKTARVWMVLPPGAGPPPEWFPDFLRYMAQMRLNSDGEFETLKPDDWLALRERMRAVRRGSAALDTPYLRILRRHVPSRRTWVRVRITGRRGKRRRQMVLSVRRNISQ